jgi:hypothetical protein
MNTQEYNMIVVMALRDISCCEHTTYNIRVYECTTSKKLASERSSPVDAAAGHFYNCKKKKVKKHQATSYEQAPSGQVILFICNGRRLAGSTAAQWQQQRNRN